MISIFLSKFIFMAGRTILFRLLDLLRFYLFQKLNKFLRFLVLCVVVLVARHHGRSIARSLDPTGMKPAGTKVLHDEDSYERRLAIWFRNQIFIIFHNHFFCIFLNLSLPRKKLGRSNKTKSLLHK